ncbi:transposase DDE domain protein [Brevibacillus laterosporus LMG 15441]|uniref:Transposase DDE domain protein n=1 Tax=Brevibacillus laterosporus LMG 15441 TaxID=1042163 RepID=A0A075R7T5_BRELA|nr:transposase DDE domain protein [Brevibacillus laterosporus LMG 15441]
MLTMNTMIAMFVLQMKYYLMKQQLVRGIECNRSNPSICKDCSFRNQCTNSKDAVKKISRHIWAKYIEEADHLRHTSKNREIYSRRKETIELVFADLKEKHGLRWTTLRGIKKVTMQVMLVFAAMNLKKLSTWLWNPEKEKRKLLQLLIFSQQKIKQTLLISVA